MMDIKECDCYYSNPLIEFLKMKFMNGGNVVLFMIPPKYSGYKILPQLTWFIPSDNVLQLFVPVKRRRWNLFFYKGYIKEYHNG